LREDFFVLRSSLRKRKKSGAEKWYYEPDPADAGKSGGLQGEVKREECKTESD